MPNDKRTLLLVTIGIVVIWLVVSQRMVIAPQQRRLDGIHKALQEEQELLRVQQAIAKNWPVVKQYQMRLPDVSSPDWLMREVARLAEQAHVQLRSIEPELSRPYERGATRMTVRVQLESNYHDVGMFLSLLESSPKYIHVEEIDMRPSKGLSEISAEADPKHFLASVRMVLSTLYLPPIAGP